MLANPANFYERTRAARKVIVVDLGFLGDTVHLVPALWELKQNYPAAALHVLTTPVGAQVLELAPCVERAWAIEVDPAKRTLRQQWQIIRELRRERFDVAFNFSGADRTVFMTALTGARWRVGHTGARWHFWNPWLVPTWVARQNPDLVVSEQRRQVLAACGLKLGAPRWDLALSEAVRRWSESLVPTPAVHFSINASSPLKEWPVESWVDLARRLLAEDPDLKIVVTSSANAREQERLKAFVAGAGNQRLAALSPGLSIAKLAAVLQRCRLHVGGDSGVLHLAVAMGLSTVSLFREYGDVSAWMPAGTAHQFLRVPCRCVNQRQQPCVATGRAECLARIEPARVSALVLEQLRAALGDALK
jgi:ADP-heptose:LPS heptosyltransferase